jgi:hypothetical protein
MVVSCMPNSIQYILLGSQLNQAVYELQVGACSSRKPRASKAREHCQALAQSQRARVHDSVQKQALPLLLIYRPTHTQIFYFVTIVDNYFFYTALVVL